MIKTSTPSLTQFPAETAQKDPAGEDLNEEEALFFTNLKGHLDKIEEHPHPDTVDAILKYSKSL